MFKNKVFIIVCLVLGQSNCYCNNIDYNKPFNNNDLERISAAIYLAEGGKNTNFPFGIKSINTFGDYNKAKKICINTILNNQKRWFDSGKTNDFITFLGSRFCPPTAHKLNVNWRKNVKYFLDKP